MHHNITPEKMREEIEEHDGMNGLVEQVLLAKTIDFLGSNATVDSAPATPVPRPPSRINNDTIRDTKISLNPSSFRWWSNRPAAASAATISTRGC